MIGIRALKKLVSPKAKGLHLSFVSRHSGVCRNPVGHLNCIETNLDAGLRRHDIVLLGKKAIGFNSDEKQ